MMVTETQTNTQSIHLQIFIPFEFIYITNTENIMLIRIPIVIYEIGIEYNILQVKTR